MKEWDPVDMKSNRPLSIHSIKKEWYQLLGIRSLKKEWDQPRMEVDRPLHQSMGGQGTTYGNLLESVIEEH